MVKWGVQLHSPPLSLSCCCSSLSWQKGSPPGIFVTARTGLLDMWPDFSEVLEWDAGHGRGENCTVTLVQLKHTLCPKESCFFRKLDNILCYKWCSYKGENNTSIGATLLWVKPQIKLLCLFNSKLTFLRVGCCNSVRLFRSPVTCTYFFCTCFFF